MRVLDRTIQCPAYSGFYCKSKHASMAWTRVVKERGCFDEHMQFRGVYSDATFSIYELLSLITLFPGFPEFSPSSQRRFPPSTNPLCLVQCSVVEGCIRRTQLGHRCCF